MEGDIKPLIYFMDDYRRLKIKELKYCQEKEKKEELHGLISSWNKAQRYPSGNFIEQFIEVCDTYVIKLVDALFQAEKTILTKNPLTPENFFSELQKDLSKLIEDEYYEIRCKVYNHCERMDNNSRGIGLSKVKEKENSRYEYINTRIKTLQEELKMGILQPATVTTIHVKGDVGVINTGIVYGSIQIKLAQLKKSSQVELAEAFTRLTETINSSNIIDEKKREQLGNVEFLVTQCETPKEKRNRGVINSIVNSISTAANIATIWEYAGPIILKFFGIN